MREFEDYSGDTLRIEVVRPTVFEPGEVHLLSFEGQDVAVLHFTADDADQIAAALTEAARQARGEA